MSEEKIRSEQEEVEEAQALSPEELEQIAGGVQEQASKLK